MRPTKLFPPVRSARPRPGSLSPFQVACVVSLRASDLSRLRLSRQWTSATGTYRPLAPLCGYSLMTLPGHFFPAGHAKHGATPTGAFDWPRCGQSGTWGSVPTSERRYQNDIDAHCLPQLSENFFCIRSVTMSHSQFSGTSYQKLFRLFSCIFNTFLLSFC